MASSSSDEMTDSVGWVEYEKCTTSELRKLVHTRKLRQVNLDLYERESLISLLEKADEPHSFPRFEDLPAELRVRIYEHHIDDLSREYGLDIPPQPPITGVNRLARKEALPIFYVRYTFGMPVSD